MLGLAAAAGAARVIQTLLFDVRPLEPLVYAGVAVIFALVAALACLLPSLRASRIDPLRRAAGGLAQSSSRPRASAPAPTLYESQAGYRNRFLTTNQTLAGRSARRRMYQANQYSP